MRLALPIVWSDRHRLHEPGGEVWIGVRTPGTEVPRRTEARLGHAQAARLGGGDGRAQRALGAGRRAQPNSASGLGCRGS